MGGEWGVLSCALIERRGGEEEESMSVSMSKLVLMLMSIPDHLAARQSDHNVN